ncbi:G-protein coupled receptor Mth2-like isoform X2 [Galleria mellonella]|uniref:G-protein coupled receptor Mth2-like isoform X2 n=1 Tax=Galleria mellonella TaxID=7137 RepID=A0ABM3MQ29_GALME|nr:G-protein coupled receptor Mth2-like isoform X2 [Galleria mellonella]
MAVLIFCIFFLLMHSVKSEKLKCDDRNFTDSMGANISGDYCKEKPCILTRTRGFCVKVISKKSVKCANFTSLLANTTDSELLRYQYVYRYNYTTDVIEKSNKTFPESFHLLRHKNSNITRNCFTDSTVMDYQNFIPYILENGSLLLETPNLGQRFQLIRNYKYILMFFIKDDKKYASVQFIKEELSTINDRKTVLIAIGPLVNFCTMSSFMWMNAISFAIWRRFRGTEYNHKLSRREMWHKFLFYGLYAWLITAILVLIEVIINRIDLKHLPNFIKPSFETCMYNPKSKLLYLLVPILVILIINTVLFCLTTFNMWLVRKELSRFNSKETKNTKRNENRFVLHLKLSMVMGVNWIFEVLGAQNLLPQWLENVADVYNVLTGVFIFFVFILKSNIILKICKRFNVNNRFTKHLEKRVKSTAQRNTSTSHSTISGTGEQYVDMLPMRS